MRDPATALDLDTKLARFDAHADDAVGFLVQWLRDHAEDIVALARGRHVWGHYRYGDRNFQEWDENQLLVAIAEELADGVVYASKHIADALERGDSPRFR